MAIVILEGPDGSGKTTLADHLCKELGYIYLHTGVPGSEDLLVQYAMQIQGARQMSVSVVLDRLHVGESVYGPLLRKKDRLDGAYGQAIIQRFVQASGAVLVFCRPPYQTAFSNWKTRHLEGKELVDQESVYFGIYNRYEWWEKATIFEEALHYDYSSCSLGDISETILQESMRRPRLPLECIGNPRAKFLFVGERANQEDLDAPWVAMGNSSKFLNDSLWEAGFLESEMAFVNATQIDGTHNNLAAIIDRIRPQEVVSLGEVADKALGSIPHYKIEHPAYWRRFHSRRGNNYVQRLKDVRVHAAGPSV